MRTAARICFLVVLVLVPISTGAKTPPVDVSNASIQCNTVTGIMKIKPALSDTGGATSTVIDVKGALADCGTGPNPVSILSGTFSGTLTGTSNDCGGFFSGTQSLPGMLSFKWKADPTTPIVPTSSTMNVLAGASFAFTASWGTNYSQVGLGSRLVAGEFVTGAFTGGDSGMMAGGFVIPVEDANTISANCASSKGLKTLHIGFGRFSLF